MDKSFSKIGKKMKAGALMTALLLLSFLPSSTQAESAGATPVIEILSPTPNAIHYRGERLQFEVQITSGDTGHAFRVEWDKTWDGNDINAPYPEVVEGGAVTSFPVNLRVYPDDYPSIVTEGYVPATPGQKLFRVRITDLSTSLSAVKTGSYYSLDNLAFSGYTWSGASSPPGNPDALGWTSFSCANQNVVCPSYPAYGVRLSGSVSDSVKATLLNNAWVGEESPSGSGTLGWLVFNKGYCDGGSSSGQYCDVSAPGGACPGGTCKDLGDPPGGTCLSGLFPGQACYDDTGCPTSFSGGTYSGESPCTAQDTENWNTRESSYLYSDRQPVSDAVGTRWRYPSQLSGWARFLSLRKFASSQLGLTESNNGLPDDANTWGWIHLRGPEVPTGVCANGTTPGAACTESRGGLCGAGGTCAASYANVYTNLAGGGYHICSDCSPDNAKCNICSKVQIDPADTAPASWKSYSCNSCYGCTATGTCDTCQKCDQYGVSFDGQKARLVGYAWAGGEDQGGLGWMQFDPLCNGNPNTPCGGIGVLQAWLATRYGDIFVNTKDAQGRSISTTSPLPAPPGTFNATYLIQANGTIAFSSRSGYLQPDYPSKIKLPTAGNQYVNVLGRLDFPTMTQIGKNRYGTTVAFGSVSDLYEPGNPARIRLGGNIYYHQGDLTIDVSADSSDNTLTFDPGGSTYPPSGAGTIIVDGDLRIRSNMVYNIADTVGNIVNIPSLAWLVRGDIFIDPAIGSTGTSTAPNLVGAFLALGCPGTSGSPPVTPACGATIKDGVLSTGDTSALELVVNGLMMASRFNFERKIVSDRGSEQIIYDGRLIANPPPGLQDLTAVLPVIREVTP